METDEIIDDQDLFEDQSSLPEGVRAVLDSFEQKFESDEEDAYTLCHQMQVALNELGYDMDYGLDGIPYDLHEAPELLSVESGPSPC